MSFLSKARVGWVSDTTSVPSTCLAEIALRQLVALSLTVSLAHMARTTGDTADAFEHFADDIANPERLRAGLVAAAHETAQVEAATLQVAAGIMDKRLAAGRTRAG